MTMPVKDAPFLEERTAAVMESVFNDPIVKKALDQAVPQEIFTIEEQIEICEVPAPPMKEQTRAAMIAEKINEVLGTEGLPERTETPSDEWCQTVKVELVKQSMTVNELAKQLDVSRDRLSLVINGKMMNEAIVSGVNNLLGINLVAVPADK